jgi:hypothetical protein
MCAVEGIRLEEFSSLEIKSYRDEFSGTQMIQLFAQGMIEELLLR